MNTTRDPNIPLLVRALMASRLAAQSVGLRLAAAVIVVAASIALVASVTSTAAQSDERMWPADDAGEIEDEGSEDEGIEGDAPVASTATQTCVEEGENLGTLMLGAATIERSGELSDGDCRVTPVPWWGSDHWVDRFVFTLSEPTAIRVELLEDHGSFDPATDTGRQPQRFDAYLVLNNQDGSQVASDDDSGAGNNALIHSNDLLAAGTYEIVATSTSPSKAPTRHLYRLTVSSVRPCEVEPLGVLADVSATTLSRTGSFATSGCVAETYRETYSLGAVYLFELAEPRSVQIDLQGLDGVNPHLTLKPRDQGWTTASDDDAGPGRDASIRHNLRAGEWRIEAGTVGDSDGTGRYRLTLTVEAAPSCEEDQLGLIHGTVERSGEFGVDGCITQLESWNSLYWSAIHVFSLAEPGRIQIDLDGIDGVDPYLGLTDEQGNVVVRDWDGGAGRGARIERELAAGTYRINAQRQDGYQGEPGGRYRLTIDATSQPVPASLDAGRIFVRRLADGRTEFGWLPKDATERILPRSRTLGTTAEVGRWLRSSPVEVAGVAIGRINVRLLEDGRVEFGFTPTNGERILPRSRWLPADPPTDRWLRSSEIDFSESTE